MELVNYILVNDSAAKGNACESRHRFIPHLGHCTECFAVQGFKVQGSIERTKLLEELVSLRRKWPNAKILGFSEIGPETCNLKPGTHARIHPSDAMNRLRKELSDYP